MSDVAIEIINLSKLFYAAKGVSQFIFNPLGKAKKVLAVNRVNLEIKKGEIVALLGPNQAGKTTLIKLLAGLILPTEGKACINGYDVIKDDIRVKNSVGLLTGEERNFYWRLTGKENLSFFASLYNLPKKEAERRIEELAAFLGIEDLDKRFQEYSSGMKQRVAIARSMLNDPPIIFMDEPTNNLDPLAAEDIRNLIKKKLVEDQGKTVLFCTHNLAEAASMGSRVAIMHKGRIKACDTLEGLRKKAGLPNGLDIKQIFRHYVSK